MHRILKFFWLVFRARASAQPVRDGVLQTHGVTFFSNILKVIEEKKPRWFLLENVKGLSSCEASHHERPLTTNGGDAG